MQGNEQEYIMALFPLIPAMAIAAAGIGAYGKYRAAKANKPIKQEAFKRKAQTGYLRKYMSDLQGRSASRARTELAMRPALRAIGAQQQQGQRQLAYQSAQQGLEGSGIEAQKQLALQAGTTQAVAGLGEKVLNQQLTEARQLQAQREGQRMKLAGEIGRQEGATAEANRMAEFQANEQYRQQKLAHDQQLEGIAYQGIADTLGAGITAAVPGITASQALKKKTDATMEYQKSLQGGGGSTGVVPTITPPSAADLRANVMDQYSQNVGVRAGSTAPYQFTSQFQRQPQANFAYQQLQNGGIVYEDFLTAVPGIKKKYQELEKTKQAEQDVKLAEHKKQLQIEAEAEKQYEIDKATEQKRIEDANLLAQQQFEQSEIDKQKQFETGQLESETERIAKIKSDYAKFETKEGKKQQAYEKELGKYDAKEKERIANIKGDYGAYADALKSQYGVEDYDSAVGVVKDSPEFKMLEEKKNVLEKFNIGEEHYDKLRAGFEKGTGSDQLLDAELTAREEELLKKQKPISAPTNASNREKRYYLNNMINEAGRGDDEYSLPSYETFSDYLQATKDEGKMGSFLKVNKRKKKKLLKKYAKQQDKMMPDEFQMKKKLVAGVTEEPEEVEPGEFKIKEKLVAEDLPEYQPGEAPTPQELAQEEYKPKYTAEAPTLQEITAEEIEKIQREQIKTMYEAGIDVMGNVAKAQKNREEMEFAKLLADPNVDPNQLFQTSYGKQNPIKIAKIINERREAGTQFANEQIETNVISGVNTALETGDPSAIMDQVSSSDPEYAELLKTNPKKAFSMRKSARIEADKIASSNSSDAQLATQMNDAKRSIDTILWAVGDEGTSKAIMKVLDSAGNEESITEAHLETIRGLLDNMTASAGGEANLKTQLEAGEITEREYNFNLKILQAIGKDNSGIKKQILSKLNKEKFVRDEVKKVSPWDDSPEVISETTE